MSKYIWPKIFQQKLKDKIKLDKEGYVKYPAAITDIFDIIEDAIRQERKGKHGVRINKS